MNGIHDAERRDEQLGAALRALPVPDHAPEFAALLRRELEAAPAAAGRRSRLWGGLAARRSARRGDDRARLRLAPGLALAAVACAVALVLLLPGGTHTPAGSLGVEPATASQVGVRVTHALADIDALAAELIVRERAASDAPLRTSRARVLLTSGGDVRIEGADRDVAYHADSGTETILRDPVLLGVMVTHGLAPGAPDHVVDRTGALQLASVARALRAAGGIPVRDVTYAGRPAWRIALRAAVDVRALPGDTGDRVEIVVDRASGIPLRVRETYRGRFVREQRLEHVRVDPRIPASAFAPPTPPDGVQQINGGFTTIPFGEARAAVGYAPLVPRRLPAGFVRAETAVAASAPSTGAERMNPPSSDVVSTAYRNGLQTIVVTTRRVGSDPRAWTDPVAAPEGFLVQPRRVCFTRGALSGRCGQELVAPRATPHVWAIANGLVVTVAGDLTAAELRRAASSLAPAG